MGAGEGGGVALLELLAGEAAVAGEVVEQGRLVRKR
jgi:hypothetical protein